MAGGRQDEPKLDFPDHDTLYATHALHAFAAKCPPQLVDWALEQYTHPGEVVLDPMAGSGTTLVEAVLRGRHAIGCDIDPLARLIAKVKATPILASSVDVAGNEVLNRFREQQVEDQDLSSEYPSLRGFDRWFHPTVADDLALLKRCILQIDTGQDVQDFLIVAFSSLITARTSVANVRDLVHSRHHYQPHADVPDVGAVFQKRLRRMRAQMESFVDERDRHPWQSSAVVLADDARSLTLPDESVQMVFTSPPYCNALDYTRAHTFSVAWLSDVLATSTADYVRLGRDYIGSERGSASLAPCRIPDPPLVASLVEEVAERDEKRGRILARYFGDMFLVLAEAARVVRPGGRVVLVVCPSNIRKVEVPTHRAFVEIAEALGDLTGSRHRLRCEGVIERTLDDRRRLLPYMQEAYGQRMRTEYVVVLRKEGLARRNAPRESLDGQ